MSKNYYGDAKTILADVWDQANHRIRTVAGGAGGVPFYGKLEDILADCWDQAGHFLRTSGGGGGGGGVTVISDQTVTGAAVATLSVPGIAGTFKELVVTMDGRADTSGAGNAFVTVQVNQSVGNNHQAGGAQIWTNGVSGNIGGLTDTANINSAVCGWLGTAGQLGGSFTMWFPNYAGAVLYKKWHSTGYFQVGGFGTADQRCLQTVGALNEIGAITRLDFAIQNGYKFDVGTRLTVLGM